MNDVSRVLTAVELGDPKAAEQLLPLVYDELRKLAALKLAQERPGQTLHGPYKLTDQIGEGGMGVVYMAEQTSPVRRTVALKVIRPGMDTRKVVARFEAERQALALMNHAKIARVL